MLALDPQFFGRELDFSSGRAALVEQCLFMRSNGRESIFATVRRVIVPCRAVERVEGMVRAAGFETPVVALEDL